MVGMRATGGRGAWTAAAVLAAVAAVASPLCAAGAGGGHGRPLAREVPDDPFLAVPRGSRVTAPAFSAASGGFLTVQVNVDEAGMNIVGDAANEPSITVDPTDPRRLAIGWRQFDTVQSNFRQAGVGHSRDAGRSWTFPGPLDAGHFRSDPVLGSDADGVFFYHSLMSDFHCDVFISTDGGATWGPPIPAFGGDKAWFTIDTTASPGRGNIYEAWSIFGNPFSPNQFTRSIDGGATWLDPIELPAPQPRWGTLTVNGAGELFISGIANDDTFRVVMSPDARDGGTPTFTSNVRVELGGPLGRGDGPNPAGLLGQVWIAADTSGGPTDGNLYMLASVVPGGDDPLDVMFSRSEDGGATWSAPVRVNDDPPGTNAWQWFGTMSVAPDGRIDVVWNDTRASGRENVSEVYYAFSEDAGVTWSGNLAVSPAFDSWIGWPDQNKIGDYSDMVSDTVGANLAFAATFNGEQDVYFMRLGEFDCNGNGVGDTQDIAGGTSEDINGNGIPDECECPADVDGSGSVGVADLLAVLAAWGPCPPPCPPDVNADGAVGFEDLLAVLRGWGACP